MERTDVVVVGAGITGLSLDRALARRGIGSLVLESASRPGGIIHSPEVEGRVLEMGPQRTRLVGPVRRLVDELGLGDRVLTAPDDFRLYILRDGELRLVPLTPGEFVRTDLLTLRGKLRMLLEPLTGPAKPGETVKEYVTRKLGREAHDYLVGPLYAGLYGSDPDRMLVDRTLGKALRTVGFSGRSLVVAGARWMLTGGPAPPAASFVDGMQELTDALSREAGDRVTLETPVTGIRPSDGEDGARWRVSTGEGEVAAREVVLTCPAHVASDVLRDAAPDAADRLGRLNYNPLAMVHLCGDCALEGHGFQVAPQEGLATRGVTYNATLFGRDGVYTAYLGAVTWPRVEELPLEEIGEVARREFAGITGCETRVLHAGRTEMPAWDLSWTALEGLRLPDGLHLCANYVSRAGIPGRIIAAEEQAEALAAALRGGEGRRES